MDDLMREVLLTRAAVYMAIAVMYASRYSKDKASDVLFAAGWFAFAVFTIISAYR